MTSQRHPHRRLETRRHPPESSVLPWWLLYICFVVYGSLVPLDFHPIPWDQAWERFQHIHLLNIGAQGRADWVANGVLYLPVGLLTAHLFAGNNWRRVSMLAVAAALAFSFSLALVVEFAQLSFPPRTVSLNDVIAEFIGSSLGVLFATAWSERLRALLNALAGDQERLLDRLLKAYTVGYFAFSLFPYDFLLSTTEFDLKMHSDSWGWLMATSVANGSVAISIAKLFAEVLATVPLGFMIARRKPGRRPWPTSQAILTGAALGLAIEAAQFFVVSGISQGISVLTRMFGMYVGVLLWLHTSSLHPSRLAAGFRRFGPLVGICYLLAIAAVTGWFEHNWMSMDRALQALQEVRFLPFYYHYYTTEQAALLSLVSVCLMYAPIGILTWASWLSPTLGMWIAILTASVMETSKLFLEGQHPDPTNLFIAGLAAWITTKMARRLASMSIHPGKNSGGSHPNNTWSMPKGHRPHLGSGASLDQQLAEEGQGAASTLTATPTLPLSTPTTSGNVVLLACAAGVAWGVMSFPFQPALLGLLIAVYAVVLWFWPQALIIAIPAALPLFDLAPWSGRFYFDEFDLLLLVSLAIGSLRAPGSAQKFKSDPLFFVLAALVGLSYIIGAMRGMPTWHMPDANALTSYYSPFNGWRIAKGALWAFLLYGLLGRFAKAGQGVHRMFAQGMVTGLAVTVAVVFWERMAFPGLLNFTDVYRVTGPFSQMHIGGADLEAFLTLAAPFLIILIFAQHGWAARLAGLGLLLGTIYAVMVTFSRVGYVGYGVAVALALFAAMTTHGKQGLASVFKRGAAVLVLMALTLAVAAPIFTGRFAQERMSQSGSDLAMRQAHWADALEMRDSDWATTFFGMGLGRYPETHYWRSGEVRAASHRLMAEADNTFLRLGSGSPLYMEQFVAVEAGQSYTFKAVVRSNQDNAQLTVSLCEKWLLTSARCIFQTIPVTASGTWQPVQAQLRTDKIGSAPWFAPRPVKFSLYNANSRALLDVDNVQMPSTEGDALVTNGDFSNGLDRWFFSVDNDRPWHIWSLPVHIIFEQGWLGMVSLACFFAIAVWRAGCQAWRGEALYGALLAALVGLAVIGTLDSLVDSPRLLMLILLQAAISGSRSIPAK